VQPEERELERHFLEDLDRSQQINLPRWEGRPACQRTFEAVTATIRRWL
jgi:hypothetical protein